MTLVVVAGDNFYNLGFCFFVFKTIVGDEPLFFITLSEEGGRGVSRPILKSLWEVNHPVYLLPPCQETGAHPILKS